MNGEWGIKTIIHHSPRRHIMSEDSENFYVAEPRAIYGDDLRERTKAFALRIISLFRSLPKATEAQVIGKQMLRAGTSVGANYREGSRARSTAEMIAKFGICLQELDETKYWIELLSEAEIVESARLTSLFDEADQLIAILTSSCRTLAQRER